MDLVTQIDEDKFQSEVLEAATPVLVDFSAVWCGPCKMLDPIVKDLAGEWGNKVKVVKIDVDHNPNLAMQYQVMGVPT
ncbi:MAG: thiol reductase thioredoxin, partial [Chloroflexi bacterium]|nr:thiol reductase thioredoxin [Chloroflexota bacterium]